MQSSEDNSLLADDGGQAQPIEIKFNEDEGSNSTLGPDVISSETELGEERLGLPRLEVHSVRFLRKDEEYEENIWPHLFGLIAIQGSSGTSILFNRKVGDPRLVDSEGLVKLNGVRQLLKADSDILIKSYVFGAKFLKWNKHPPGMLWRAKSAKSCHYDKLLRTQVDTGFGSVEVRCAVYKEATEAIVDIALTNLIGHNITEFHGTITAWNTKVPGAISCIFQEEDICVDLGKVESIGLSLPLCRRVVAVPCKSLLIIKVQISRGNEIFADEKIKLPARLDGEDLQSIVCKDGTVVVKITWQNDGPDKVQEWIGGGQSNNVQYQLCDCSSRPLKVPRLTALTSSSLRPFYVGDAHIMESYECSAMDRNDMRLEIFSVRFVNQEKLDVSKIYGTIMMDVGSTKFVLYNRKVGDPPLIDSEGFVMLTAPRHGMVIDCTILVFHYLFNLESMVSHDSEQWWSDTWCNTWCDTGGDLPIDQLLSRQMESEFGPIDLTFAVYDPGAEASLEVKLVNYEVKGPIEISGHIKAKNSVVCDSKAFSSLFKGAVTCMSDDIISGSIVLPLLRQAVVVPLHSKMILDVCIDICGRNFASGELVIDAMKYGTKFEVLKDCYGNDRIRIKVSWGYTTHEESLEYCW